MNNKQKQSEKFYAVVSAIARFIEEADKNTTPNPGDGSANNAGQNGKDVVNHGS